MMMPHHINNVPLYIILTISRCLTNLTVYELFIPAIITSAPVIIICTQKHVALPFQIKRMKPEVKVVV